MHWESKVYPKRTGVCLQILGFSTSDLCSYALIQLWFFLKDVHLCWLPFRKFWTQRIQLQLTCKILGCYVPENKSCAFGCACRAHPTATGDHLIKVLIGLATCTVPHCPGQCVCMYLYVKMCVHVHLFSFCTVKIRYGLQSEAQRRVMEMKSGESRGSLGGKGESKTDRGFDEMLFDL